MVSVEDYNQRALTLTVQIRVGYAPHQVLHFYFVYRAQAAAPAYSDEWRWFNWDMFKLNFFFVAVKFTFSHFFYNGLSAVLPLWCVLTTT